jgi:hypothetical protein
MPDTENRLESLLSEAAQVLRSLTRDPTVFERQARKLVGDDLIRTGLVTSLSTPGLGAVFLDVWLVSERRVYGLSVYQNGSIASSIYGVSKILALNVELTDQVAVGSVVLGTVLTSRLTVDIGRVDQLIAFLRSLGDLAWGK